MYLPHIRFIRLNEFCLYPFSPRLQRMLAFNSAVPATSHDGVIFLEFPNDVSLL